MVRSVSAFTPQAGGPGAGQTDEREPVPESLLATVDAVPGVASASGDVSGYAQMIDPATGKAIGSVGSPDDRLELDRHRTPRSCSVPAGRRRGRATWWWTPAPPGGTTSRSASGSVSTSSDRQGTFTISGVVRVRSPRTTSGGATLALFETPTAQRVLNKQGVFDSIAVEGRPRRRRHRPSRRAIQRVLPQGVEAVTSASVADEQAKAIKDGLGFFRTALLVFAFIALFVGAFIIFNTFSIIVAQRSKETRSAASDRRQPAAGAGLGGHRGVVVGLVASAVGVLVGHRRSPPGSEGSSSAFGIDLPGNATQS